MGIGQILVKEYKISVRRNKFKGLLSNVVTMVNNEKLEGC